MWDELEKIIWLKLIFFPYESNKKKKRKKKGKMYLIQGEAFWLIQS